MTQDEIETTATALAIYGASHFERGLGDLLGIAKPHEAEGIKAGFPDLFRKFGPGSDAYKTVLGARQFFSRRDAA